MPKIILYTEIQSSLEIVFDLSRSIDLHQISTAQTNEEAIAGKTSGLIGLNESVTWRARHFGIYQKLTSKITEFERPNYFVDEMVSGAFKRFKHEHIFTKVGDKVVMKDIFDYTSPALFLGKIADKLFLQSYMEKLLTERNRVVKEFAESERWKEVLNTDCDLKNEPTREDFQLAWERIVEIGCDNYDQLIKDEQIWFNIEPLYLRGPWDLYMNGSTENIEDLIIHLEALNFHQVANDIRDFNKIYFPNGIPGSLEEIETIFNNAPEEKLEADIEKLEFNMWECDDKIEEELLKHIIGTGIGNLPKRN